MLVIGGRTSVTRRGRGGRDHHVPVRHVGQGRAGRPRRSVDAPADQRHGPVRDRPAHHHHADPAPGRACSTGGRSTTCSGGSCPRARDATRPETELPVDGPPRHGRRARAGAGRRRRSFAGSASRRTSSASWRSPASTSTCERGEILGLIGPNGSGKTTLLNVDLRGLPPDRRDRSSWTDREIGGLKAHRVAEMGLSRTFQNIRLFSQLTVRENVEAAARARHRPGGRGRACSPRSAWSTSSGRKR